jgi:hypothetical protein
MSNEPLREMTVEEIMESVRMNLKNQEKRLRAVKNHSLFYGEQTYGGQHKEMLDQLMLAVRHIEDARMRCGKVLQFSGDGVSIYDKAGKA